MSCGAESRPLSHGVKIKCTGWVATRVLLPGARTTRPRRSPRRPRLSTPGFENDGVYQAERLIKLIAGKKHVDFQ